jgi:hypothetical protein
MGISFGFMGLFESDLTVEHYDRRKIGILAVRPFKSAGMADLCAGSGFEGAVARYRAHIEMVEEGIFHWMLSLV